MEHSTIHRTNSSLSATTAINGDDTDEDVTQAQTVDDITQYFSPIHRKLLEALNHSSILAPLFVHVKNESYWYSMRKSLGPRRHSALIVKQNQLSMRWEAYIFKLKPRDEDYEIVPQKHFVSHHKSKWSAFKKCEIACKQRDESPADNTATRDNIDSTKLLSSHFRILVVSAVFYRMTNLERLALIHDELTRIAGVNVMTNETRATQGLAESFANCHPNKMKIGSKFGNNMCSLPIFRYLDLGTKLPVTLLIEARTPSQWKPQVYGAPDSERFGESHMGARSLDIPRGLLPAAHKHRVKQLTSLPSHMSQMLGLPQESITSTASATTTSRFPSIQKSSSSLKTSSQTLSLPPFTIADTLGVDPLISGHKYKKSGGIYGHFFRDLSPGVHDMVLARYKDNKTLIQREGNMKPEAAKSKKKKKLMEALLQGAGDEGEMTRMSSSASFATTTSTHRRKQETLSKMSEYDKGTATEQEMIEEVYMAAKKVERAVIRMQRIRRMHVLRRCVSLTWWRYYAAITIQRVLRGHFGRQYSRLLSRLKPMAACRIQGFFRHYKAKQLVKCWRWLSYRLTRVALPKIKLFLKNCIISWIRKRQAKLVAIQSLIRMYLCRVHYFKTLGHRYFIASNLINKAATDIQRMMRGRWGKRRHASLYENVLVAKIDNPAAKRIQRIYRGRMGRVRASWFRKRLHCVLIIQHVIRKFVHRIWDKQVQRAQLEKFSATCIQKIVRKRIAVDITQWRRKNYWYNTVYIPNIIKIQAQIRRYHAVNRLSVVRKNFHAAAMIQRQYRKYLKRLETMAMWRKQRNIFRNAMAAKIQKTMRRFFARLHFYRMKMEYDGRVILAAKTILRAWVNYKHAKRFQVLLQGHRMSVFRTKTKKVCKSYKKVALELDEIKADHSQATKSIEKIKERIKEVDLFVVEASSRIPKIQMEMMGLNPEDFERGWAEAFAHEYESLNHQLHMAREEIRLQKAILLKRKKEMMELLFEQEDVELELDQLCVLEVEAIEGMRRTEVHYIDIKVNDKLARAIRREKCHWKVDSTRTKVIKRNRPGYQAILDKAKAGAGRDLVYSQTVAYEPRARAQDKEELLAQKMFDEDGRSRENTHKTYDQFVQPFDRTFNAVVANTNSLLRGVTLDERAHRIKEQYKSVEVARKKATGGQFASLKSEFVADKQSFSKY